MRTKNTSAYNIINRDPTHISCNNLTVVNLPRVVYFYRGLLFRPIFKQLGYTGKLHETSYIKVCIFYL